MYKPSMKLRILEAAYELLEKSNLESITVQQIVERCGISRKTFYNHFSDKYAVFEWSYEQDILGYLKEVSEEYTWREAMDDMIRGIKETPVACRKLPRSDMRHTFYDALYGAFRELLCKYDLDRDEELVFQMDFFCTAGVDKVARWISGGCKENPEKLSRQLAECLPAGLRTALIEIHIF